MYEIFEIHGGKHAAAMGWDFTVCRNLQETMGILEQDLDDLEEDGEIKVVFKRYTQEQMDDVVFE